ncbi:hypothetical protein LNP74_27900 [Klebsiella pneumoniae subsp. pneumoniae]|nr:hypothetical protein [Klebsiella pneumoniae subsp. pneumoniae]
MVNVRTEPARGKPLRNRHRTAGQRCAASARRAVRRGRIFADVNSLSIPVDFRGQLVTVVGDRSPGWLTARWAARRINLVLLSATGYKRWNVVQQVCDASATYRPVDAGSAPLGLRLWRLGLGTIPALLRWRNVVTE